MEDAVAVFDRSGQSRCHPYPMSAEVSPFIHRWRVSAASSTLASLLPRKPLRLRCWPSRRLPQLRAVTAIGNSCCSFSGVALNLLSEPRPLFRIPTAMGARCAAIRLVSQRGFPDRVAVGRSVRGRLVIPATFVGYLVDDSGFAGRDHRIFLPSFLLVALAATASRPRVLIRGGSSCRVRMAPPLVTHSSVRVFCWASLPLGDWLTVASALAIARCSVRGGNGVIALIARRPRWA